MRNRIASSPKIGDLFSTRLRRGNRLAVPDFCFPGILPRAAIAAIAGLILAAAPLAAREEVTRDVQKSATLRSGQRVTVDHRLGDVVIRTTTSTNATVAARIRVSAPNRAEAQRFADAIEVVVNESTLELAISTRYPDSERNRDVSYGVSYEITMPESSPLRVANRFGSVRVSGLKADADIRNGQGSIEFTDGRGTQHLENRFGPIEVRNNTGDVTIVNGNANVTVTEVTGRIDIRNQFGSVEVGRAGSSVKIDNRNANVNVDEVKGDANVINSFGRVSVSRTDGKVTIENRNGEIDVRDLRGFADLRTSFARIGASNLQSGVRASNRNGGVDFNNITGDVSAETSFARLTARTVNGNFTAENRNGAIEGRSIQGAVRASTSFDAVTLEQVSGGVDVTNRNGAVTVREIVGANPACRPVVVRNSFGPIRVSLPASSNYDLMANTSSARIHSDFPLSVSGNLDPKSISGKIGSGGCQLDLSNRNGSIDLLRTP